jgi:hypothetical protein
LDAFPEVIPPGEVVFAFLVGKCTFDGIFCGSLHYPVEVVFTDAALLGVGGGVAEVDGIGDAIAEGELDCIEVIAEEVVDAQHDLLHFPESFGGGPEVCLVAEVVGVTGLIRHDPDVFAADTVAAVVFGEDDLFL